MGATWLRSAPCLTKASWRKLGTGAHLSLVFSWGLTRDEHEHSGTAADHPPERRLFECRAGRAALGDDAHFVVRQAGKDAQRDRQRQLRVVDQRYPDIEVPAPLRRFEDELGRLESERRRLRDAHDLVE